MPCGCSLCGYPDDVGRDEGDGEPEALIGDAREPVPLDGERRVSVEMATVRQGPHERPQ